VDYNETLVGTAYVQALSPESPRPVVLVINADNEAGYRLACEVIGSATVHEIADDYRHRRRAATMILGVPSQEAVGTILSYQFPDAITDLDQPLPTGHFRVAVVDGGGMICRSQPIPEFQIATDKTMQFIPP
jgi:hypothetical protein